MSESSNKQSRKTKLVPRVCTDDDDDALSSPKKAKPMIEVPAPIQFDVKIEVEEFNEDENFDYYANSEIDESNNTSDSFTIKTEVIDDIEDGNENEADDSDSTSMAEDIEEMNKKSLLKNIYQLSQRSARAVKQCKINDDSVFEELDTLLKTDLSPADKILAIEVRNSWGRIASATHTLSKIDATIQAALNDWKNWSQGSKVRGTPLLYKCYICTTAWWHLHEFREHLVTTHDTPDLNCFLELSYHESFVAADFGKMTSKSEDFTVDNDCWRCEKDYNFHKRGNRHAGPFYKCEFCEVKFFTCIMYIEHQGSCVEYRKFLKRNMNLTESNPMLEFYRCFICKMVLTNKEVLHKHYKHYHSIRSDLPTVNTMKYCGLCGRNYAHQTFHSCPKRNYSIICNHCGMRFPSKVTKDMHKQLMYEQNFKCRICNNVLPSKCLEIKHVAIKHSTNFKLLYKCVTCDENIFLLDELSMKQHTVIWHKKKFDKRRNFVEMVVVPEKCVTAGMVEQLDIVTSLSGKFEIVAKPNSNGVLEVSQVEEINFNNNKKQKSSDKSTAKVVIDEGKSDDDLEYTIVEEQYFEISDDDDDSGKINDVKSSTNDSNDKNPNEDSEISDRKDNCKPKGKDTNSESPQLVKVKEEKDDEIQESIQEVDKIFNKVIEQTPKLENTSEKDDYAALLSKVFGGSHVIDTNDIQIKVEATDEEYFEDDIIVLARNAQLKETESNNDAITKDIDDESNDNTKEVFDTIEPSTSSQSSYKLRGRKCRQCNAEGSRLECMKHFSNCSDQYKCTTCNTDFETIDEYAWHFTSHGYNKNVCPKCDKNLVKQESIAVHIKVHVRNSFYKVQVLENSNEGNNVIEGNIDLLYTCKECKENVDVELLFVHWEKHLNMDKKSMQKMVLNSKIKTSLDQEVLIEIKERLLANESCKGSRGCCLCDRVFTRKHDHKRHLIEHLLTDALSVYEENKGLACQFCEEKVKKADHFRQHLRDHAALPVFRCELCQKSFSDSSNFAKHRKVHNFIFEQCDVCGKKFHNAITLEKHKESHVRNKPLKCTCCDQTFLHEAAYKRHMRSINRQRNGFKCHFCLIRFSTIKEKWDHMWTSHKMRKDQADCPICHKSFRRYQDVRLHMRDDHNKKVSYLNKNLLKIINSAGKKEVESTSTANPDDDDEMYVFMEGYDNEDDDDDEK